MWVCAKHPAAHTHTHTARANAYIHRNHAHTHRTHTAHTNMRTNLHGNTHTNKHTHMHTQHASRQRQQHIHRSAHTHARAHTIRKEKGSDIHAELRRYVFKHNGSAIDTKQVTAHTHAHTPQLSQSFCHASFTLAAGLHQVISGAFKLAEHCQGQGQGCFIHTRG